MLGRLSYYFHTVRYLRATQIYGRIWFKLARSKPDQSPLPLRSEFNGVWVVPAARKQTLVGLDEFTFLGITGSLAADGWDNPDKTKLWRYNQHYFDDLNAQGAEARRKWHESLIVEWIKNNPVTIGTAWEPYPTSLRIVNWVKYALSGGTLTADGRLSLAVQARWLTSRLEWHILGNHLFANAKALMFAGFFFEGADAEKFRAIAWKIIDEQLAEQILKDGGQFELSPMYHALALEDILDLLNLWSAYQSSLKPKELDLQQRCRALVPLMLRWLKTMSHPDGKIAFFNDAAFDIAPGNSELDSYAERLGFKAVHALDNLVYLEDSGYARLALGPAMLIVDVAMVGPDYLPGHAHADSLSFELSLFSSRLFVNSGTSEYGLGQERHRQRGTEAHNTVTVASENSSEVWAGFRVARRARVYDVTVSEGADKLSVSAHHDGYRRISSDLDHWRSWELSENSLVIEDALTQAVAATAYYHLHPDIEVEVSGSAHGSLLMPGGEKIIWRADAKSVRVIRSSWHPQFGVNNPSKCLCLELADGKAMLKLDWS